MGADSQNVFLNAQDSAAVVGAGDARVDVTNSFSATVTTLGGVVGVTGISAAEVSTPVPSVTRAPIPMSATSGNASAVGVRSQNTTTDSSEVSVVVGGGNEAPINVQTSHVVDVQDEGFAVVTSGSTLAKNVPGSAGMATTASNGQLASASEPISATGQVVNNDVDLSSQIMVTPVPGSTPLTVNHTTLVGIETGAWADVRSGATCGGAACQTGGASQSQASGTPVAGAVNGGLQAASGEARAQGLAAQNNTSSDTSVSVLIGGHNFGIINIVIEKITRIFNGGGAVAASGDSSATVSGAAAGQLGAAAGGGVSSASGNAAVVGNDVTNRVSVDNSMTLRIAGDNTSPIDIVLQTITNIWNRGEGNATTGRSVSVGGPSGQASGASGGASYTGVSARSGSAQATGLQVRNSVDLASSVAIDITGSNFARIKVRVIEVTNIFNLGYAVAETGQAHANAAPGAAGASWNGTGTQGGSSTLPGAANQTTASSRALPDTIGSTSGSGRAIGAQSSVYVGNDQFAAAAAPTDNRSATNNFALGAGVIGEAYVESGLAIVGPSPTPVPAVRRQTVPQTRPASPRVGGPIPQFAERYYPQQTTQNAGKQKLQLNESEFSPGSSWRERELPPMPGQRKQTPRSGADDFEPLSEWPELTMPAMPGQFLTAPVGPVASLTRGNPAAPAPGPALTVLDVGPESSEALGEESPATVDEAIVGQQLGPAVGTGGGASSAEPFPMGLMAGMALVAAALAGLAWRNRRMFKEWVESRLHPLAKPA